jgi:aryl-alcohol dehydrogenase-like predicted oxidoreductase
MRKKKDLLNRKDFLKKTSTGLLCFGLLSRTRGALCGPQDPGEEPASLRRVLGRTGLKVTPLCFGASRTMEPTLVKAALDGGINFLDTGRSYFNWQNEVMLGKALEGMRDKVVIQSKLHVRLRESGENGAADTAQKIESAMQSSIEQSLKALKTDFIDIMLIHGASSVEQIENETVMSFFAKAKDSGLIKACGFSTHSNQVALLGAANKTGFYDVVMVTFNHKGSYVHSRSGRYSEWDQKALDIELRKAEENKMGIVAMKTCSAGPYAPDDESQPTFRAAIEWVLKKSFIQAAAVAMANRSEIEEDILAMSS